MERLIIINYRSGGPGKFSTIIRDIQGMKKFADDIILDSYKLICKLKMKQKKKRKDKKRKEEEKRK